LQIRRIKDKYIRLSMFALLYVRFEMFERFDEYKTL